MMQEYSGRLVNRRGENGSHARVFEYEKGAQPEDRAPFRFSV